jgi:hypothetical protein
MPFSILNAFLNPAQRHMRVGVAGGDQYRGTCKITFIVIQVKLLAYQSTCKSYCAAILFSIAGNIFQALNKHLAKNP